VVLLVAAPLLLAVPDVRMLQNMAYGLRGYVGLVDWPVMNQLLCAFGGTLLAGTAASLLSGPRCARCERCERDARRAGFGGALGADRPLGDRGGGAGAAAVRGAAGGVEPRRIPLGVDQQFVQDLAADLEAKALGPLVAYSLPLSAAGGALLTLGLSMRWGTVVPG
jgi:hypothetical protein